MREYVNELADLLARRCGSLEELEDMIKHLFRAAIEKKLEAEMDKYLGYEKNDSSGNNTGNSRNGHNTKKLQSSFGSIDIRVPRDRKGGFKPEILEKYQKNTGNLEGKIISMYARGMSNKDIEEHMRSAYGIEVSASLVSRITDKAVPEMNEWRSRALKNTYPIVYFTRAAFKVKQTEHNTGKASERYVCTALGIDTDGRKDILGLWICEAGSESVLFWTRIFGELRERGVADIYIICSDGSMHLPSAAEQIFPDAVKQLCMIHQVSASTKYVAYVDRKEVTSDLKNIYSAATADEAENRLYEFRDKWDREYPQVSQLWELNWRYLTAFLKYPEEVRHIIYTTNIAKGFQRTMCKFAHAKTVYPTEESMYKAVYLSTAEIIKKWTEALPGWDVISGQISKQKDISLAGAGGITSGHLR